MPSRHNARASIGAQFFFGMKIFDADGYYIGRIAEVSRDRICMLKPDMATYAVTLRDAMESARRRLWLCDPSDPAILEQWSGPSDVPDPAPGLTFKDGLELGLCDGARLAEVISTPPDWLHEPPTDAYDNGDPFHFGFQSGISKGLRERLLQRFPDKPEQTLERTWANSRWGVDPLDASSIIWFQRGVELADKQENWLPELNADRIVDEALAAGVVPVGPSRLPNQVALRFGFKSRMEERFGRSF